MYLIVVEGLVDDACDGFAFVCNADEHSHIIQEALAGRCSRCSTVLDWTSSKIYLHFTCQQLILMLASDACSCSEGHAGQAGGKGKLVCCNVIFLAVYCRCRPILRVALGGRETSSPLCSI